MLLRDTIYHAIRLSILRCVLRPGQELREQILADQYRVSRSPIRDALLRLERERLVTVLPRQGYLVNPITLSDVMDIYGLRLAIEPACAAAAAAQTDAALRPLHSFRGWVNHATTLDALLEHNTALHNAIAGFSRNARVRTIGHDLVEQYDRLTRFAATAIGREDMLELGKEHDGIIDAILAHDAAGAAKCAALHVESSRGRVVAATRIAEGAAAG
ncbi:MAG TPA: GntR family transcriptional regulator [Rhodopila sp.]|nr:GntR family transcriptional regulator [Rhodopila sp.]